MSAWFLDSELSTCFTLDTIYGSTKIMMGFIEKLDHMN